MYVQSQCQVKFAQIFKLEVLLQKKTILSSFVLGFQNGISCVRKLEVPQNMLQKVTSSPLPVFYHCTTKSEDIALRCCMRIVFM